MAASQDLVDLIGGGVEVLNEDKSHRWENALKQGYRESDLVLKSDTDEQLLLNIPFKQHVGLRGMQISAAQDCGPKTSACHHLSFLLFGKKKIQMLTTVLV